MPTITKTGDFHDRTGNFSRRVAQYTGPSSYVTGGDSFPPETLGLGQIQVLLFELAINAAGTVRGLVYDTTNEKVLWYVLDTGAEVANGTDLSGFSARFEAVGK